VYLTLSRAAVATCVWVAFIGRGVSYVADFLSKPRVMMFALVLSGRPRFPVHVLCISTGVV